MAEALRILTLSTYPFANPQHGGQHRMASIVRALTRAGHEVHSIGVLGSTNYPETPGFEPYPAHEAMAKYIPNPFLMDDWAIGRVFAEDSAHFAALAAHAPGPYDVLFAEQPWLFAFAQRLAKTLKGPRPRIIYGSQNIEWQLKQSILAAYTDAATAAAGAKLVAQTEAAAIAGADAIVCVSAGDRAAIAKQTSAPIILASNGVENRAVDNAAIAAANEHSEGRKFALYCASAHPPNITGFYRYFGDGLSALAPTERLIIAGSAGPAIQQDARFAKAGNLEASCIAAGLVSEEALCGLLHTAHAIILPLSEGGGTNLKTAEALWAGRRIVGTTTAFRGFEAFMDAPGVAIADEPAQFLTALRDAMAAGPLALDAAEQQRRSAVLWEHTLAPLIAYLERL